MPRNDPTDTGGLFIGRRPGTAPVRYRDAEPSSARRRRADGLLAHLLLLVELVLCLSLFAACALHVRLRLATRKSE